MSDQPKRVATKAAVLTDREIEALADDAETGYAPDRLRPRRGRPLIGSAPGEVVPVRLDPPLRQAVQDRADADGTSVSEVMRQALRQHLEAR